VLSDYAHGCRIPTLKSVSALAKALDRTPEEFLTGPLPGEGLPTADDARAANLAWFRKVSPSQKARAALARTKPHK
jgi:hypothetical protein